VNVSGGRTERTILAATLIVYAVLQMLYITATPLQSISLPDNLPPSRVKAGDTRLLVGIGPDEKEHFLYIVSLAERGAIPAPDPLHRRGDAEYVSYQAQHPPLFYAAAVPVYLAARPLGPAGVWYLLRGLCALCGVGVIVLSARAARLAFPDRPVVALAAAPFVAFLPMFGHMTGCLSNEPLAMLLGAAAWLQMVRIVRQETPAGPRDAVLLGALLGLAALTRLTALLWVPAALIVLIYAARRRESRLPWPSVALCAACCAVLAAPWFVRNILEYGTPVLRTFYRPLLEGITLPDYIVNSSQPIQPRGFPQPIVVTPLLVMLWFASTAWVPFWLIQFYVPGGMQAAPAWQAVFLLIVIFSLVLLFLNASRARRESDAADPGGRCLLWAAGAAIAFCVLALLQQMFWTDWNVLYSPGRYIVAALPATSLLFLFALSTLARRGEKIQRSMAAVVAVVMLILAFYTVTLVRTFYRDHPRQADVQPIT